MKEILKAMGIFQLESEGYEADDLASFIVDGFIEKYHQHGHLVLVTTDSDWKQLLDESWCVELYNPIKDIMVKEKDVEPGVIPVVYAMECVSSTTLEPPLIN